ncbi:MAG: PaaI family thioesterase [Rhodospirillaceae bacterium]|nr:PaaI family thioesterase [Rhodospirillaceae bacterium]
MDMTAPAAPRRHTVRWADPAPMAVLRRARTGFDYFHPVATGALPQPPIYDLLGFRLVDLEPGRPRFEGDLGEHLLNPFGSVHGGYTATLLDSASGVALQSMLPLGKGTATIRLEIAFLRAILPAMKRVTAVSRLVHVGSRVAWSEGEVLGPDGALLARGRGCFAIFPTEPGPDAAPQPPVYSSREIAWNDPAHLRRAAIDLNGIDFIKAQAEGRIPLAPFHETAAYKPVDAGPGWTSYRCQPEPFHYNPMGSVHGGLPAILIDTAGGAAIQTAQPKGRGAAAVNLSIDYFRPITVDSGPLVTEGKLLRAGKRISLADAEVRDAKGEVCARGAVTYYGFPLTEKP